MPSDDIDLSPTAKRSLARLAVRFLGLVFLVIGGLQLVANILESLQEFHPSYILFYMQSYLLRPFLAIFTGGLLFVTSSGLARWLVRERGNS